MDLVGDGGGGKRPKNGDSNISFTNNSINSQNNPDIILYDFSLTPSITKSKKYNVDYLLEYQGIIRENNLIARGNYTKAKIVSGRFMHSGQPLAIKMINLRYAPENMLKHAKEECEAVKGLDHSGVCKTYHFFSFENIIYIIMNYPGSITLSEQISRYTYLPFETVTNYTCELVCALGYLHSRQIAHRDIKPDNILIRSLVGDGEFSELVLVDFGFSKKMKDRYQTCEVFCGTRAYKAPEIRSAMPYSPFQSDIWSLGVVICKMLISKTIFTGLSNTEVISVVSDDISKFILQHTDRSIPSDTLSVLSQMLRYSPNKRIKLHEIICSKWIHKNSKCRNILNRPENSNFVIAHPFV